MSENPLLKHVRFNKRKNSKVYSDAFNNLFGFQLKCTHNTYTRTPSWSDNNHLCKSSYYKEVVLTECKDGLPMEKVLMKKSKNKELHEKYGTFIFGPLGHSRIIKHLDGRRLKFF